MLFCDHLKWSKIRIFFDWCFLYHGFNGENWLWFWFVYSFAAIHAEAPAFVEMSIEQEILETGLKVVDLLAPYVKGGKIGELISWS